MSYATGLRPRCPWLLLHRTIKTNLFFWSAFFPKEAAREDGDCVLQVHPLLITNQILSLPSDEIQNTAQIIKKNKHLPELFTAKGLPQVLEAATNSS